MCRIRQDKTQKRAVAVGAELLAVRSSACSTGVCGMEEGATSTLKLDCRRRQRVRRAAQTTGGQSAVCRPDDRPPAPPSQRAYLSPSASFKHLPAAVHTQDRTTASISARVTALLLEQPRLTHHSHYCCRLPCLPLDLPRRRAHLLNPAALLTPGRPEPPTGLSIPLHCYPRPPEGVVPAAAATIMLE